jgi:hypothetical protein
MPENFDPMAKTPSPRSQIATDLASLLFVSEGVREPLLRAASGSNDGDALQEIGRRLDASEPQVADIVKRLQAARPLVVDQLGLGAKTAIAIDKIIEKRIGPRAIRERLRLLANGKGSVKEDAKELLADIDLFNQTLADVHDSVRPPLPAVAEVHDPVRPPLPPLTTPFPPIQPNAQHIRAGNPVLLASLAVAGLFGIACIYAGIQLVSVRESGATEFDFLGLHFTTQHAGIASIGLGAVVIILVLRRAMKTLEVLGRL